MGVVVVADFLVPDPLLLRSGNDDVASKSLPNKC